MSGYNSCQYGIITFAPVCAPEPLAASDGHRQVDLIAGLELAPLAVAEQPGRLSTLDGERLGAADDRGVLVDADDVDAPVAEERASEDVGGPTEHAVEVRQYPDVREEAQALLPPPRVAQLGNMARHHHGPGAAAGQRGATLPRRDNGAPQW